MLDKVVIDTGPLIDYLINEGVADIVQKEIIDNVKIIKVIISPITLTEIFYVLCRDKGEKFASEKASLIKNAVKVELEFKIRELAGNYKCKRPLSLADCYVLATAKLNSATAIFKKEQELVDEMKKNQFDVDIKLY